MFVCHGDKMVLDLVDRAGNTKSPGGDSSQQSHPLERLVGLVLRKSRPRGGR